MPLPAEQPVVLIGLMAAGKSAVGRELAARHGRPFVDTDQLVVDRYGPIAELFVSRGERFFREVEARAVAEALSAPGGSIVSLGGGAILDPGTRQLLARGPRVVFLDTDLATVLPRITRAGHRPLLAEDPAGRWQALADARRPIYEALAEITIDARGSSVPEIADRITRTLTEGEAPDAR